LPQPRLQCIEIQRRRGPKSQIRLNLLEMGGAGFHPLAIGVNGRRGYVQLAGYIEDRLLRGRAAVIRSEAQIAEGAELERKAQARMSLALLVDDVLIGLRQQEKGSDIFVRNRGGEVVEAVAVRGRQKADGHGVLLAANDPLLTRLRALSSWSA